MMYQRQRGIYRCSFRIIIIIAIVKSRLNVTDCVGAMTNHNLLIVIQICILSNDRLLTREVSETFLSSSFIYDRNWRGTNFAKVTNERWKRVN